MSDFEKAIRSAHPAWSFRKSVSGTATWIDIVTANDSAFTIQITPFEGIGVSKRSDNELDFGGHDEVFDDFSGVFNYLTSDTTS